MLQFSLQPFRRTRHPLQLIRIFLKEDGEERIFFVLGVRRKYSTVLIFDERKGINREMKQLGLVGEIIKQRTDIIYCCNFFPIFDV